MEKTIKVVMVEPDEKPRIITVANELEDLQNCVGGYIEVAHHLSDGALVICNEEGKLMGLPMNRILASEEFGRIVDALVGTFFICGADGEEFCSLTDEQAEYYRDTFAHKAVWL